MALIVKTQVIDDDISSIDKLGTLAEINLGENDSFILSDDEWAEALPTIKEHIFQILTLNS